jgi:hypothetical protein
VLQSASEKRRRTPSEHVPPGPIAGEERTELPALAEQLPPGRSSDGPLPTPCRPGLPYTLIRTRCLPAARSASVVCRIGRRQQLARRERQMSHLATRAGCRHDAHDTRAAIGVGTSPLPRAVRRVIAHGQLLAAAVQLRARLRDQRMATQEALQSTPEAGYPCFPARPIFFHYRGPPTPASAARTPPTSRSLGLFLSSTSPQAPCGTRRPWVAPSSALAFLCAVSIGGP